MNLLILWALIPLLALSVAASCQRTQTPTPSTPSQATEIRVGVVELDGPAARPEAEISSLGWYNGNLILLPQYPEHAGSHGESVLYALPEPAIRDFVNVQTRVLPLPKEIPFDSGSIEKQVPNFDGFEAIAFHGNTIYLTIETRSNGLSLPGTQVAPSPSYLVRGWIESNLSKIQLEPNWVEIPNPASLSNTSYEALLVYKDWLVAIYEANGANIVENPTAQVFDLDLNPLGSWPFPTIEYRITDATSPDENGRFWAINYFYLGDKEKLQPADDPLAATYGKGPSHALSEIVERLVAFQIEEGRITLADIPPVQLTLLATGEARNWEGIAILHGRAFLLATDKFPQTILGSVPYPGP